MACGDVFPVAIDSHCFNCAEPRILVESTEPITLDLITEYEDAVSGDCIIQVPEVR